MLATRDATGNVGKYIHLDGSETSIKHVSSCDTVMDPATGRFHANNSNRNKFSVFASSSRGCIMKCGFCHLTIKDAAYGRVESASVNVREAMRREALDRPDMRSKFMKLCWMGMGEDQVMRPAANLGATLDIMEDAIETGLTAGVDGCDLATVLPRRFDESLVETLVRLNEGLASLPVNPVLSSVHASNGYADRKRSLARLFYSLHGAGDESRGRLVPNATPLKDAFAFLRRFDATPIDLVFHHLFLDGVNDSPADVAALVDLLASEGMADREVRILRYNPASDRDGRTPFVESRRFDDCIAELVGRVRKLKVQISTGVDVLAACGQFVATARRAT